MNIFKSLLRTYFIEQAVHTLFHGIVRNIIAKPEGTLTFKDLAVGDHVSSIILFLAGLRFQYFKCTISRIVGSQVYFYYEKRVSPIGDSENGIASFHSETLNHMIYQ